MFIVITFILFTALVAVIAAVKTREENLDTQDGYFLAGRSLTGPVIAGSLMLTNLSTEQLVGQQARPMRPTWVRWLGSPRPVSR